MFNKIKENKGYTLMEIVVSVGIFVIAITSVSAIFRYAIEGQRRTIAVQTTEDSLRYAFEAVSKELRQAKRSDEECESIMGVTYADQNRIFNQNAAGDEIYFRNKNGECVRYYLNTAQLMRGTYDDSGLIYSGPITPDEIDISGLAFNINDNDINVQFDQRIQPYVTANFFAERNVGASRYKSPTQVQVTVASRVYE